MTPFARNNLAPRLKGKRVLLGISGSIAAFKAHDVVRFLRECGAEVRVVLTDSAQKFVTPVTLETLSGNPVLTTLWGDGQGTHHIDTARWADVAVVAPATANTIAKLARGMGDDLLTTELLAFQGPMLIAPAMNPAMFSHPAVQENLAALKRYGWKLIGPCTGVTACGEEGLGRMVEPFEIVEAVSEAFIPLHGKRALITLGPTQSPVDPVRYLSNRSSGLMGAALTWAARSSGYEVVAICGPTAVELPSGTHRIDVCTAREMLEAAQREWATSDLFISAAAVLDWDVAHPASQKLKKETGSEPPRIDLKPNADILATLAQSKRPEQFVLGFAAETERPIENAVKKLKAKGCDAIFANDVSAPGQGFGAEANAGWWISPTEIEELGPCSKPELAMKLFERISHATHSTLAASEKGHDVTLN